MKVIRKCNGNSVTESQLEKIDKGFLTDNKWIWYHDGIDQLNSILMINGESQVSKFETFSGVIRATDCELYYYENEHHHIRKLFLQIHNAHRYKLL